MYEAFEKLADVFRERPRLQAFEALHDEFIADLQRQLPPADQRPNVLLVYEGSDEPVALCLRLLETALEEIDRHRSSTS